MRLGEKTLITDWDTCTRLFLALFFGGLIGYERQSHNKSAGLRTHILVCVGSCLIAILSINIYSRVEGLTNADPARLAAQVVSGIGFLGAGTIMKEGLTVKGLTTAASLWVVSGVGLAVGSGWLLSAVFTTLVSFVTLSLLPRVEKWLCRSGGEVCFVISTFDRPGQIGKICACFGNADIGIRDIKLDEAAGGGLILTVTAGAMESGTVTAIMAALLQLDGIQSVKTE